MRPLRLLLLASLPVLAVYVYFFSDTFSGTLSTANWFVNGTANGGADGLYSAATNGGSVVYKGAIPDGTAEYEAKMTELMNWHREQERDILIRLTGEPSTGSSSSSRGSTRLRRGRSKLSERLYAAIELNT